MFFRNENIFRELNASIMSRYVYYKVVIWGGSRDVDNEKITNSEISLSLLYSSQVIGF